MRQQYPERGGGRRSRGNVRVEANRIVLPYYRNGIASAPVCPGAPNFRRLVAENANADSRKLRRPKFCVAKVFVVSVAAKNTIAGGKCAKRLDVAATRLDRTVHDVPCDDDKVRNKRIDKPNNSFRAVRTRGGAHM